MSEASIRAGFTNEALLSAWEDGAGQAPLDRALTMLRRVLPAGETHDLEAWPIGQRDGTLLDLHAATFGSRIAGTTACPSCDAELDLAFQADDVRSPRGAAGACFELSAGEPAYHLVFRLPASHDLRAAVLAEDAEDARRIVAERCILAAERGGEALPPSALPDEAIDRLEELMAFHDPQSAIDLNLTCPTCAHSWQLHFDIADFLWREVVAQARRLVSDVHTLALAYGWREEDILAMPDRRRELYLDLVL
jgi:hypothetical protein